MARRVTAARLDAEIRRAELQVSQWPESRSKAQRRAAARAAFGEGTATVDEILLADPPEVEQLRLEMDRVVALWSSVRRAGVRNWTAPMWLFTFSPGEELPEQMARSVALEFRIARRPAPPDEENVCGLNYRANWAETGLWCASLGDEQGMAYRRRAWEQIDGRWQLKPAIVEAAKFGRWASPYNGIHLSDEAVAYLKQVMSGQGLPHDATGFELIQAIERHGPARRFPKRGQR